MPMTPAQARFNQSQFLTDIFLGTGQGSMIAEKLFPRLPSKLRKILLGEMGDEQFRQYELARSPGGAYKRVNITYNSKVYDLKQKAVAVPLPEEVMDEFNAAKEDFSITSNLELTSQAVGLARAILDLDYELDAAEVARDTSSYPANHVANMTGAQQWNAPTGTPVTDIDDGKSTIRKAIGKEPNTLILSHDAKSAICKNAEVKGYLSSTQQGAATIEQLKQILEIEHIHVGDAIYKNEQGVSSDVWGNDAILSYTPNIGGTGEHGQILGQPAFGFTNVLDGHPLLKSPYFDEDFDSWIFKAKFERLINLGYKSAGFLFKNTKG